MARNPDGREQGLTLTERALTEMRANPDPAQVTAVGLARSEVLRLASATPQGATAVLALIGDWPMVFGLIIGSATGQEISGRICEAATHADHAHLRRLTDIANTIEHAWAKSEALVAIATAVANHHPADGWRTLVDLAIRPGFGADPVVLSTLIGMGDSEVVAFVVNWLRLRSSRL